MKKTKFKLNSKVALSTFMAATMLLSGATWAGISSSRSSSNSSGGAGKTSSNLTVTPGKRVEENVKISEGTASTSCKQDPDAATYFPQDFFQHISRDGSSLSFEQRGDNKVLVKFPASIDTCGKFKPQVYQDPDSKSVTVMVALEDGKTYGQYLACLTEKNILKDGKINHDDLKGDNYSEYSYVLDYSFDKTRDIKKSAKLSFGYPKAFSGKDGYAPTFGIDAAAELPSSLCMSSEKIQPQITYLNKGEDALLDDLRAICKSGDAQRIAEARRSIGNAEALRDIADKLKSELDAGYLLAVKQDVAKISAEMTKIEERLVKEKDTIDEATAKKLTKQYADLAKDLDSKFLNPAIYRLDTLMKARAGMDDEDAKTKVIDDEIKKLNDDIGGFSRRPNTSFSGVYTVMEKYALNDSAKTIEDIRLKSYWYSKVYGGPTDEKRGKAVSFEEANQKQYQGLQKFDKVLVDWTDEYLVGKGNTFPIAKTQKERAAVVDRMNKRWQDYQQTEMKNYQKYCSVGWTGSVVNPVQCQAFMSGMEQRRNAELKKREKDLLYIKGRNDKLTRMGMNYGDYQKRQVSSETKSSELYEPYGSSYTSYEDNFSDRFPGYYGNNPMTANQQGMNPQMYNLGGQPNSMMMGNYGTNNPQMVYPQNQIHQGQYQMPQMAMGSWPSY